MPQVAFSPADSVGLQTDVAYAPPSVVDVTVEQHSMLRALLGSHHGALDAERLTELLRIARAGLPETGVVDLVKAINAHDAVYVALLMV